MPHDGFDIHRVLNKYSLTFILVVFFLVSALMFAYAMKLRSISHSINFSVAAQAGDQLLNPAGRNLSSQHKPPVPGIGPTEGNANASLKIVEFTDYQCTLCGRYFTETYQQLKKEYIDTGKLRYEVRNFPLTNIHPNAMVAAEAAVCARRQGKFWDMHAKLFSNQSRWGDLADPLPSFKDYAAQIGLNADTFSDCIDQNQPQKEIEQDMADAERAGIDGTPSMWIFGAKDRVQQVNGTYPYRYFVRQFARLIRP
jgi:protein-disulfide isomerase